MQYVRQTLGAIVDQKCNEYKDREAMVFAADHSRITYAQFQVLYDSLAKSLYELGIRKGDRIALMSVNSPCWLALQIAAAKIGAVLICINTAYKEAELEYVLNHSESSMLILASGSSRTSFLNTFRKICPELEHSVPGQLNSVYLPHLKTIITDEKRPSHGVLTLSELTERGKNLPDSILDGLTLSCDDIINIQYTSGTTGKPKAVMSAHYAIVNNALVCGENMKYTPEDRLLLCLPLFHVIGCVLSGILSLLFGSTLVIVERFQTEQVLEFLEREKCTAINAVPTMFHFLLNSPDFSSESLTALNKGFIAGSCCSPALMQDIMTKLHIKELSNVYGQTEAIAITQTVPGDSLDNLIHTIGRPLEGVEAKIIDPATKKALCSSLSGELYIKSEYLMKGYYKNKAATESAVDSEGWLHTGDLAVMDSQGYIRIMGRIKDIIIRGGENISPVEIENLLKEYDGIQEVAVIGFPDPALGEEICALIVSNDSTITEDELLDFLRSRLAKFKVPKYIRFVEDLPMTSSGKIQKFLLKEQLQKEYAVSEALR